MQNTSLQVLRVTGLLTALSMLGGPSFRLLVCTQSKAGMEGAFSFFPELSLAYTHFFLAFHLISFHLISFHIKWLWFVFSCLEITESYQKTWNRAQGPRKAGKGCSSWPSALEEVQAKLLYEGDMQDGSVFLSQWSKGTLAIQESSFPSSKPGHCLWVHSGALVLLTSQLVRRRKRAPLLFSQENNHILSAYFPLDRF